MVFGQDPRGEVAVGGVDEAGPRGDFVGVHGHLGLVSGGLDRGQILNLGNGEILVFAEGQAAVHGNGAAVRHRTAGGRGVENLGNGEGALAEEGVVREPGIELFKLGHDVGHAVDGVVAAFRGGTVAGYAAYVHADFHAPALAAIDAAVGGFGGYHKFGLQPVFVDDVLPAQAVAVLFLHRSDHDDGAVLGTQAKLFDDLPGINHAGHAAFLIARAAPADGFGVFVAFVGIKGPVGTVADAHGIDVRVKGDDAGAISDKAEDVAHLVDFDPVEADLFHFFLDTPDHAFFLAAFARDADHIAQESGHFRFILFGEFVNTGKIDGAHGKPPEE